MIWTRCNRSVGPKGTDRPLQRLGLRGVGSQLRYDIIHMERSSRNRLPTPLLSPGHGVGDARSLNTSSLKIGQRSGQLGHGGEIVAASFCGKELSQVAEDT